MRTTNWYIQLKYNTETILFMKYLIICMRGMYMKAKFPFNVRFGIGLWSWYIHDIKTMQELSFLLFVALHVEVKHINIINNAADW